MTDLPTLKARIDAAEEGSREIDADLHLALTTFEPRRAGPGWPDENDLVVPELPGWKLLPHYTTSIDAVVRLIEAKLPEHFWSIFPVTDEQIEAHPDALEHHTYGVSLFRYLHVADRQDATGFGATPALALLSAFLRAYKEQTNDR